MSLHRARWVVGAGVCAALHVCKLPPALPLLQTELGISLVQAGFLLSFVQLAGMSLGLVVGLMADRWGLRRSLLWGLVLLGLASVLGAWAHSVWALLGLRAIEGLGFLLVTMPAPALIRRLVPVQRMSAMLGWWGTFMPLGAMLALLLGPWWMGLVGWQGLWLALGVLTLGVAFRLWLLLPADVGVEAGKDSRKETTKDQTGAADWWLRLSQTLTQAGPWLVAGCFAVYSCQWMAVIGFLPTIYLQAGYSTDSTALLTAVVAGSNMLGNVASGWLLGRGVAARRVLWMGYGAMGLGTVGAFSGVLGGLPLEMELVGRFASVVLFSALGGVVPGTLYTLAVRVAPNERTISTTVGWMQQWSALGQFSGAPLVAATAAYMGGWQWTWCVTAVCASIGLVLAWRLGQRGQA